MDRPTELTPQEQEEVVKLFEEFARLEEPQAEEEELPPTPEKKKLSKNALVGICVAGATLLLAVCIVVWILWPDPQPDMQNVTLAANFQTVMAVTTEGKVLPLYTGASESGLAIKDVLEWTDIVSIDVGELHAIGLKSDGTVVCTGFYPTESPTLQLPDSRQISTESWKDIIAVSAGSRHSVGLRKDGTVVAVGDNSYGQCRVDDWTDIIQISAGDHHTVGLKKDGTVVCTNIPSGQPDDGQCNVSTWTDIVFICAGPQTTIAVRDDGTVVSAGANGVGQCNVATWTDIVSVAAGQYHTVGLNKDGTVVCTDIIQNPLSSCFADFGQGKVGTWKDIAAVAVTDQQTIGLKKDGTVVLAGQPPAVIAVIDPPQDIRVP